jgi:hypothetical protein
MTPFKITPVLAFTLMVGLIASAASGRDVSVNWLEAAPPATAAPVSFGVPWPRGEVQKGQVFTLAGADGKALPVQSWTLAYWPDGSVKWTGIRDRRGAQAEGPLKLSPGMARRPPPGRLQPSVSVRRADTGTIIDTGRLHCRIPNSGDDHHRHARRGRAAASPKTARLDLHPPGWARMAMSPAAPPRAAEIRGQRIDKVTVEQDPAPCARSSRSRAGIRALSQRPEVAALRRAPVFLRGPRIRARWCTRIIYRRRPGPRLHPRPRLSVFGVPMREEVQNRHVRLLRRGRRACGRSPSSRWWAARAMG